MLELMLYREAGGVGYNVAIPIQLNELKAVNKLKQLKGKYYANNTK